MYGRRPRAKKVEQVMAEIEALHDLGTRNIFVVDDNFIGNKKLAKELLIAIIDWQRQHHQPMEFMTEVSLNISQDDELLRLMRQANFTTIFIGIESPRVASLEETKKNQNLRENLLDSVHRIQRAGIDVMAGMIVGFDHDDTDIFEEQFRFIQDARIPISMTGMLNALPKTPLYKRLQEAGRLGAESVGDQFVLTNIIPKGMTLAELHTGYRKLLERLYSYGNYRRRVMELILNKGMEIEQKLVTGRQDLAIFARVLWTCVVSASPRRAWLTLSLMIETLLRRPKALRDAVTFALVHKHLYEYMKETCRRLEQLSPAVPEGATRA
jgi:radical SAM superfamily enzyme YgiQ (UPF0313 family)